MTGIEISLLIIGSIFMIGSFFVSEKLSGAEINRIAELSDNELKRIIEKGMKNAENRIEEVVDEKIEETAERVEVALERESNLKIMAIGEYSDTVFESMKKTHDEIMFLYSMLNDKHTEMTGLTGDLQRLAANVRNLQENVHNIEEAKVNSTESANLPKEVIATEDTDKETVEETLTADIDEDLEFVKIGEMENHNDMILALHKEGLSKVDIARKLSLGVGEVSLVIGLYKGEEE